MSNIEIQSDVGEIAYERQNTTVTWKINNFFTFPGRVDLCLDSPVFNFLDAVWSLRLYPNGESKEYSDGYISFYLMKEYSRNTPKHRVQFSVGIMMRNGNLKDFTTAQYTFEEDGYGRGWPEFCQTSMLRKNRNEVVPEGVLTVVCTMSANMSEGVQAAVQTETPLGLEKLMHDFNDLLLSEDETDLVLKVQNRKFKVHRAILLARSPVFSAMLKHDMKEKLSGFIEIEDCDPDAFEHFLTYLYSGNTKSFSTDIIFGLHTIADKYDAQELKASCIQYMMENLSIATFCDALSASLQHNETRLLEKTTVFFAKNLMKVLVSPKWLAFVKQNPVESNELYIKAAKYNAKET